MTTLAICAIFKDERPALPEWIAYHRVVGVDHFFLYDNESTDGGASILRNSPLRDYITVVPIAGRPAQQQAYKHFVDSEAHNWEWAAFIDLDEFIHPIEAESVKELLPRYGSYSGVLLHWLIFGPNGRDRRPNGLVIENYTRRVPEIFGANRVVKSLVRIADLIGLLGTAHVFDTKGPMCNSRGELVPKEPIQDGACHDVMCINHYYTKSREDWEAKLRRGRVDVLGPAPDDMQDVWFDEYTRLANVPDARITRFAKHVRKLLGADIRNTDRTPDATPFSEG
jgi:hypothetical protein